MAVGSELVLGHVVDTNSAWLGRRLAAAGVECHFQTKVGDDPGRIAAALRVALERSDAVIVCGGLGPTPDDVTREAIADVMGAPLVREEAVLERVRAVLAARGRRMSASNARQSDVPSGATVIPQAIGTAPGLACPVGDRVVYAVPGVPAEMEEMVDRAVVPELRSRLVEPATIVSRTLRTWGMAESAVAEALAPRVEALGAADGRLTMAFLASATGGVEVRLTARAASDAAARGMLDEEEREVRSRLGVAVFGVDEETMQGAVGALLERAGSSLAVGESLTGGLVAARLVDVAGASAWFRGSVVAYDARAKFDVLGVPEGRVVSDQAAASMAEGARQVLGADVGLGLTGVAGPEPQEGVAAGTVFVGISLGSSTEAVRLRLGGDRQRVRQHAAMSALDLLRRRLLERAEGAASEP
ncbi:MAG: competence/damage-inducible protein A [Actinomycetota bacterium]|nr:competence/damage-inducible protein A [Actinomycetota bacterium]